MENPNGAHAHAEFGPHRLRGERETVPREVERGLPHENQVECSHSNGGILIV